jgi:hypothetical protein
VLCTTCTPGSIVEVGAGTGVVSSGASTCTACIAGQFSAVPTTACTTCGAAQYSARPGGAICASCAPDRYTANAAVAALTIPGTGVELGATHCHSCPSGKVNPDMGDSKCDELLTVTMAIDYPPPSNFAAEFRVSMAATLRVDPSLLVMVATRPGSVVVDFVVLDNASLAVSNRGQVDEALTIFRHKFPSSTQPLLLDCDATMQCAEGTTVDTRPTSAVRTPAACCVASCAGWGSSHSCAAGTTTPVYSAWASESLDTIAEANGANCCLDDLSRFEMLCFVGAGVAVLLVILTSGCFIVKNFEHTEEKTAPDLDTVVDNALLVSKQEEQYRKELKKLMEEARQAMDSDAMGRRDAVTGNLKPVDQDAYYYSKISKADLEQYLKDANVPDLHHTASQSPFCTCTNYTRLDQKADALRSRLRNFPIVHSDLEGKLTKVKRAVLGGAPMALTVAAVVDMFLDLFTTFNTYKSDKLVVDDLFPASLTIATTSIASGLIGSVYFVFLAKLKDSEGLEIPDESTGTPKLLINRDKLESNMKVYILLLLVSASNPETLALMPWADEVAAKRFGGLPNVPVSIFCTVVAALETLPQLAFQAIYVNRKAASTDTQMDLNVTISIISSVVQFIVHVLGRYATAMLMLRSKKVNPQVRPLQQTGTDKTEGDMIGMVPSTELVAVQNTMAQQSTEIEMLKSDNEVLKSQTSELELELEVFKGQTQSTIATLSERLDRAVSNLSELFKTTDVKEDERMHAEPVDDTLLPGSLPIP